ncbi:MAG: hypothetical protein N2Z64_05280 [Dictyoglomus thermophilum]|nr:hypothetical protein [Dictyoglomus thermophilum]MCX7720679.1 hypothetical protein [Dictyoglomus thermophilum]
MIYVIIDELILETQKVGETKFYTIRTVLGFAIMILLNLALG